MLNVTTMYAVDPATTKAMDTSKLRDTFHVPGMFEDGKINLT